MYLLDRYICKVLFYDIVNNITKMNLHLRMDKIEIYKLRGLKRKNEHSFYIYINNI